MRRHSSATPTAVLTASGVEASPIPFAPPSIGDAEVDAVVATLRSGWLTTGPQVAAFEKAFADYTGARHAVAVNSGTAALHLSLLAAGVGAGDEVITTPLTFCATANAIIHTGATPVFADVDASTFNLDPSRVEDAITPRTRALLPVHFGGRPAAMSAFESLARPRHLTLIEDAAHCVEGVSEGRKVGAIGDFTCFSFYATKNLTTGEGGMVTTDDAQTAAFIRTASLHGLSRAAWNRYAPGGKGDYDVLLAGFKYNMMDIQAALGLQQLARIGAMHARRAQIWAAYDRAFAQLPLRRPAAIAARDVHARHLYTVLVEPSEAGITREELEARLQARGISTSRHFRALHLHSYYQRRFDLERGQFPVAERISDTTLSLPLSSSMAPEVVDRVIEAVHDSFR
ncbi:MAG: DegT/DnrJ/EryC1/StrS family aminotransferase [Vicinamibacterales bacterium]